jgi:bacterioferritin-associated ferredoxin
MYVCVCNSVTDRDIRKACEKGTCTMDQLTQELNVANCCGRCHDCARKILNQSIAENFTMNQQVMVATA